MNILRSGITLLLCLYSINSIANDTSLAIIPEPLSVIQGKGTYTLPAAITIASPATEEAGWVVSTLKTQLANATGKNISAGTAASATITLQTASGEAAALGTEGYRLTVNGKGIVISAASPAGWFYGVQTLFQLLPKEIENKTPVKNITWKVPYVTIMDKPRFGWRGLMFDVSRHFFTKQEVKQFIDDMVRYKYNLLHLHLTDDEGWRIEIKGFPRLTTVGAWNVKKEGYFGTFPKPAPNEPKNYGGFYTQDDIRELVK